MGRRHFFLFTSSPSLFFVGSHIPVHVAQPSFYPSSPSSNLHPTRGHEAKIYRRIHHDSPQENGETRVTPWERGQQQQQSQSHNHKVTPWERWQQQQQQSKSHKHFLAPAWRRSNMRVKGGNAHSSVVKEEMLLGPPGHEHAMTNTWGQNDDDDDVSAPPVLYSSFVRHHFPPPLDNTTSSTHNINTALSSAHTPLTLTQISSQEETHGSIWRRIFVDYWFVTFTIILLFLIFPSVMSATQWDMLVWGKKKIHPKDTPKKPGFSKAEMVDSVMGRLEFGEFKESLLGCTNDWAICFHSFVFCFSWPIYRAIDTYVTSEIIRKEYILCWCGFFTICQPFFFFWVVPYLRPKVRASMGGSAKLTIKDILGVWFCLFCAIAQEAREVDREANIHTDFCCSLSWYDSRKPLGSAVKIQKSAATVASAPSSTLYEEEALT